MMNALTALDDRCVWSHPFRHFADFRKRRMASESRKAKDGTLPLPLGFE